MQGVKCVICDDQEAQASDTLCADCRQDQNEYDRKAQGSEAFIEVNDPHVAVRMRRPVNAEEWQILIASDAGLLIEEAQKVQRSIKPASKTPRLSTSDTHRAAYFELLNLEDSNAVADKLKAKLIDLGYKITTERFPV